MIAVALLLALVSTAAVAEPVRPNDNARTAGRLDGNVLTVQLVAEMGTWHPNGPKGAHAVAAFGEAGAPLSVPGPLIRGVAGTNVVVTLRNALGSELRVWGLCAGAGPCDPIPVAVGSSRETRFSLTTPGTYYYWASWSAKTVASRPRVESQLGGAIVVDPPSGAVDDRILIVTALANPQPVGPCGADTGPDAVFAINGASSASKNCRTRVGVIRHTHPGAKVARWLKIDVTVARSNFCSVRNGPVAIAGSSVIP